MRLLTVEYDEETGTILLTLVGDEDEAMLCDTFIDDDVVVTRP